MDIKKIYLKCRKIVPPVTTKISLLFLFFITELEKIFSDWKAFVSAEDEKNIKSEEELIKFLKDKKRAQIYRSISDLRSTYLEQLINNPDKSITDLSSELITFSHKKLDEWLHIEGGLSDVILKFRSKDFEKDVAEVSFVFEKTIDVWKNTTNQKVVENEILIDKETEVWKSSAFEINGEKNYGFLSSIDNHVRKIKREIRNRVEENKKIVTEVFVNLTSQKLNTLKEKKLPLENVKRSDFWSDEEETNLERKVETALDESFEKIKSLNEETLKIAGYNFLGTNNISEIIQRVNEYEGKELNSSDKILFNDLLQNGFLILGAFRLGSKGASDFFKEKDKVLNTLQALSKAGTILKQSSKLKKVELAKVFEDPIYQWCNKDSWAVLKHIATFGFCSSFTATVNLITLIKGQVVDLDGIANVISAVSYIVMITTGNFAALLSALLSDLYCEVGKQILNYYKFDGDLFSFLCSVFDPIGQSVEKKLKKWNLFKK